MSDALNSNRLIAGSRFLITMNGNTFKSGVDPIANVDNNVLVMNIVYGNTTLLAVVNDNWNSRVSTVNVSLGSLVVNAFDSSCNVNAAESSRVSLKLYYGAQLDCTLQGSNVSVPFFGFDTSSRFISGQFSASSLYLSNPRSGPYVFCICTGNSSSLLCASKSFRIDPGVPVDLVLNSVLLGSSFSSSSAGLVGCVSPECGSNAYIEFTASAFDINQNRVPYTNYSFTVFVEPLSGTSQAVVLWDFSSNNVADLKDGNNNNNVLNPSSLFRMPLCTLSSATCKLFISGVRGGSYSLRISLASFGSSDVPGQMISVFQREYNLAASPISLANFSLPSNLFNVSAPSLASSGQVSQRSPSFSINSFIIAPCPSDSQVPALAFFNASNDRSFGRCQCSPGYQQNRPASASDVGRGFGDTIGCSVCPANSYQQYAGGAVESCSKCPGSLNSSLPSSTLNAIGQTSVSACQCAPGFLFVRITTLSTTTNIISEVCQGSYNTSAPADCFCLPCDATKQTCTGGSTFYPRSADAVNSTVSSAVSSTTNSQSATSLSYFSFYNNPAYYDFLANDTGSGSLNSTASPLVPFYRLSSAAMACKPRGDNQFSCLQQSVMDGNTVVRQVYNGSQCEVGYSGFLCTNCAVYPFQIYAKGSGQTCVKCATDQKNAIRFYLFLFVIAILLVCSYFIGEARKPSSVKNKFSVGTKTFLNHMQVLSFMSDLQSSWSSLIRSMFGIANLSNLGVNVGTLGCEATFTFKNTLILYCTSPFILSSVPVLIYFVRCMWCYKILWSDTRRRLRLASNHQHNAALLNLDKGYDLDYIESRYNLEETELLHLSLTWKNHLSQFKKDLITRADITSEEAINLRFQLGQKLLIKQFWTDSVVVVMVVTFLLFSTISRQIFYTFSIRKYQPYLPYSSPLMPADSEHEFQVMDQAPDIFVNSSEYKETANFAIVCLVFYCILLPIYLFVLLKQRYKSIFDKPGSTSHRTFNFLVHGYNVEHYYWEVVVTVRKIIISAIIVFLNQINLRFQIYCIMLVLGVCFYATVSFRPFVQRKAHLMELLSLAVLLFTCICGLMMNDVLYIETSATVSASVISDEDKVKNNVFGIVTLVLNIVALTFIIFTVLPEYRVIKRVISLIQKSRIVVKTRAATTIIRKRNSVARFGSTNNVTELEELDKTPVDDDIGTMLPRRSAYEVEQRARLLQQQLVDELDLPEDAADDSLDYLLDDRGPQPVSAPQPLITPFNVYDLHAD